jgi:hypothetical protein
MSIIYYNELLQNANNNMDDRLIELLNERMNTNEQKQFINNFKNYLEYGNDDTKFIISLDNVWEWIGFNTKGNAKRLLINKFTENINYIIHLAERINGLLGSEKELILLNVTTFKKFCMKASTNRADEICDYYVKMENIMNQYTKEKMIELENSNKQLSSMIQIEEEININELFWNENSISDYNNKNVVYLAFIGYINGIAYYKLGMSKQIYTREFEQHKKTFDTFIMIHIELCDNMMVVENEFKLELKSKNLLRTLEINGKNQTELFITNPQNDIKKIIQNLKDLVIKFPLEVIKETQNEIEKLKHEHEIEIFKKEIDTLNKEIKALNKEIINNNEFCNYIKKENTKITEDYTKLKLKYKNLKKNINQTIEPVNNIIEHIIEPINEIIEPVNEIIEPINEIIEPVNEIIEPTIRKTTSIITDLAREKFNKKEDIKEITTKYTPKEDIFESLEADNTDYQKNVDLFLDKYVEVGKDNTYRLESVKFYKFYATKFYRPWSRIKFNDYLKAKYDINTAENIHCGYGHRRTWLGIQIKNVKTHIEPIQYIIEYFIKNFCEFGENLRITTRIFNKIFKEFCEINEFITTKYNGWSERKCTTALDNLGYLPAQKKTSQIYYKGLTIRDEYIDK